MTMGPLLDYWLPQPSGVKVNKMLMKMIMMMMLTLTMMMVNLMMMMLDDDDNSDAPILGCDNLEQDVEVEDNINNFG